MPKCSIAALSVHILLFVLAISEIALVKGIQYCDKDATYYRGTCKDDKCANNCHIHENGERGYCRQDGENPICVCVYDCAKLQPSIPIAPPPKNKSPPPPKKEKPTPPKPTQFDD
nr:hypothetical protein [Tanacetum cinerariifolium]